MENEIWKDIKDYEGLYRISSMGNIVSLDRKSWNGKSFFIKKGRKMKARSLRLGYKVVGLTKNLHTKTFTVHRLVCINFLENTENKEYVNHKNLIKTDNRLCNLEWVTNRENSIHYLESVSKHNNCIYKRGINYLVRLRYKNTRYSFGTYNTIEKATNARDYALKIISNNPEIDNLPKIIKYIKIKFK